MRCSKCGAENPVGKKFCGDCGSALGNVCPKCQADNPAGKRFCGECGASLEASSTASSPHKSAAPAVRVNEALDTEKLEGERKTVTALFADIKGSTELEQDLDPEEARAIVDPALKLMIEAVQRYDGYVVQSTGDGIFAIFGAPVAHEDHPQRALYAALRMQEELRRYGSKLQEQGRAPIEIRIGVNTGEVVVRSISTGGAKPEYTPIGHTANLASRLQAIARTGSIVVSEETRKLVEGYFALKSLGASRVRGIAEPINVYEVTGLGPLRTRLQRGAARGLTKFVGREREMEAVRKAAEQAKAGHGQIVAAVAEAGTGKSRLFFEFKAKNQSGWMVLEAFSVSHGKASAYLPVLDLLHTYFKITSDDDARTRREKVTGRVLALDRTLEDALPYLFALLGIVEGEDSLAQMDGQIKKRRTLDAIKRILLRESLNQPLIVMFEDLHWIDSETQEFLNLLADSIANTKILLLFNYRPEYSHHWGSRTYYTQLRLDPLGSESADEMLSALLGDGADLAPLKRVIIERTEGNPFFMEETVQVLLDEGALVRNGAIRLTRPITELKIPPTVQGILAARIDRLPADTKDLLQTLSVIGREFPMSLISAVVPKPAEDLDRMLNDLQLDEFIYEQPAVGDTEYVFKHALTQEVAYSSVLIERRKTLHEVTARTIESLFKDQISDHLGDLVNHYQRSGNIGQTTRYLYLSAQQAVGRSAFGEAIDQLTTALEMLARLPRDAERVRLEADMQLSLARVLASAHGPGVSKVGSAYARARELYSEVGDDGQLFEASDGLRSYHMSRLEPQQTNALIQELLSIAERTKDSSLLGRAYSDLGMASYGAGDLLAAQDQLARAHASNRSLLSPRALMWSLGYPEQAARATHVTFDPPSSPAPLLRATELAGDSYVNILLGEWQRGKSEADAAFAIATEHGFPFPMYLAQVLRQWALVREGQGKESLSELTRARETIQTALGSPLILAYLPLAEAYHRISRVEAGLEVLNEGLSLLESRGLLMLVPEMHRLKGELLRAQDASGAEPAEREFRSAIELSRTQKAKSWELRATTSLARLLRDTSRRDEARSMLSDIYNWFTEGFDTADLKDAKALLDELA